MNFPLAVAQAVRDELGPKLIAGFRVTPFEAESDGYTLDDAKQLVDELARLNLDYISVSLDDYRRSRPAGETRVYSGPVEETASPAVSPITEIAQSRALGGEDDTFDLIGIEEVDLAGRRVSDLDFFG